MAEKRLDIQVSVSGAERSASQVAALRQEVQRVNEQVNTGSRSQRLFYATQGRRQSRTFVEQQVRDEMATRIKAMRAEALRTRVADEVQMRLFGAPQQLEAVGAKAAKAVAPIDRLALALKKAFGGGIAGKIGGVADAVGILPGAAGGALAGIAAVLAADAITRDVYRKRMEGVAWNDIVNEFARKVPVFGLPADYLLAKQEVSKDVQKRAAVERSAKIDEINEFLRDRRRERMNAAGRAADDFGEQERFLRDQLKDQNLILEPWRRKQIQDELAKLRSEGPFRTLSDARTNPNAGLQSVTGFDSVAFDGQRVIDTRQREANRLLEEMLKKLAAIEANTTEQAKQPRIMLESF